MESMEKSKEIKILKNKRFMDKDRVRISSEVGRRLQLLHYTNEFNFISFPFYPREWLQNSQKCPTQKLMECG